MNPVICDSCRASFAVKALSDQQAVALWNQHEYDSASAELKLLLKVRSFYRRHPEAQRRIQSHATRVLLSDDLAVQEQRNAGVPIDEIRLPPDPYAEFLIESGEDRDVIEYLLRQSIELEDQLAVASELVVKIADSDRIARCPRCAEGEFRVPREHWEAFAEEDVVIFYRPQWHNVDDEGNIEIRVSFWGRTSHSSGRMQVEPNSPDYDFWSWLIDQDAYYRPVREDEIPEIRKEWKAFADKEQAY